MAHKVFWLEPTGDAELELRRYSAGTDCPSSGRGYHNVCVVIGRAPVLYGDVTSEGHRYLAALVPPPQDDPRWPTHCSCGYAFTAEDPRQLNQEQLYRTRDDREYRLHSAPVGAMWDAWWMPDVYKGSDGLSVMVRTPGGEWGVDMEASNCTRKGDRTHKCWVRHGDPRTDFLHVDKDGPTCQAGGGSIMIGSYHGFLHNGMLTS